MIRPAKITRMHAGTIVTTARIAAPVSRIAGILTAPPSST
jgi:hypothetical protein